MRAMVSITSLRTAGSAGWASSTSTRAFGERAHVAAAGDRAIVDRLSVGMDREGVGEDQRRAALGRGVMHRDRDHAAQRQAADMRAIDAERLIAGKDRGGIIVARGVLRAQGRCRRSPDNRTRSRAARARNGRAADATPICPSRRREGTRSAFSRRRRLRRSRSLVPR